MSYTSAVDLTQRLVSVDSVSPTTGNLGVARLLIPYLDSLGFHVGIFQRDHANVNIIARLEGAENSEGFAFVGHLDTVTYKEQQEQGRWSCHPLGGEISGGRIWGRGTTDMKGSIAAAIFALKRYAGDTLRRPCYLILTDSEEIGHKGAKELLALGLLNPSAIRHAIVGEPTSLAPAITHPAIEETDITVYGKGGHGSRPHLGTNALYVASRIMNGLEELDLRFQKEMHPTFKHLAAVSFNAGKAFGGEAPNMIPEGAWIKTQYRQFPIPGEKPKNIHGIIEETAKGVGKTYGVRVDPVYVRNDPGFIISPDAMIVRFLQERSSQEPIAVEFSSEAAEMQQARIRQIAVFGPGDIDDAHQPNESLSLEQLAMAEEIYAEAIRTFCK